MQNVDYDIFQLIINLRDVEMRCFADRRVCLHCAKKRQLGNRIQLWPHSTKYKEMTSSLDESSDNKSMNLFIVFRD